MTTKPKARKFRIRRTAPSTPPDPTKGGSTDAPVGSDDSGKATSNHAQPAREAGGQDAETKVQNTPGASNVPGAEVDIAAIRNEGLTGRQLRMARRVAQRRNLAPASDFDAVRLLRLEGIDPFKRSDLLELVSPVTDAKSRDAHPPGGGKARIQLPQTLPENTPSLPSTEVSPADRRTREITEIQRDIVRRRQRKIALLLTRLAFFVFLPAFLAGWYFYMIATPMYATKSEFLILQADNAGGGSGLGGLLSGTQFATNQDSIAVQSYLQSKDAMLRLNEDSGFEAHYTQESLDPIQRLDPDPSTEQAYKTYKKNVKIGYDPTEGVIRMEVIAANPEVATLFSKRLIAYAEDRVNNLTQQKRGDQMTDARESFDNAVKERRMAQEDLVTLQQQGAILDPESVILSLRNQINNIELQLLEKELQLAALLDNERPNQSRVDGARGDVRRLEDQLAVLNAKMTDASQGENSLANLTLNIQMAQADLATRDLLLQSALQSMEQTRMEAGRQVRYLTISVEPIPSEDPSYPRAFENTILAFLIFGGIYLMISITASILREQVTS